MNGPELENQLSAFSPERLGTMQHQPGSFYSTQPGEDKEREKLLSVDHVQPTDKGRGKKNC